MNIHTIELHIASSKDYSFSIFEKETKPKQPLFEESNGIANSIHIEYIPPTSLFTHIVQSIS